MFLAWSGDVDGSNGATEPPDWTGYMKHIRKDRKNEHADAIVPGVSSLYKVITDRSIDEDPTAKETIQAIIRRTDEWRVRLNKRAVFLEADAGELIPIIKQLVGSPLEDHIFPWPGGLHIVFAMMGSVATIMDGWGAAAAMAACKWFGSSANAVKALKAKDYNRTLHSCAHRADARTAPHSLLGLTTCVALCIFDRGDIGPENVLGDHRGETHRQLRRARRL